eukprot:CAMPEP_0184484670 /NCGR_PEP_ID=MMETSP0113_2-20130426/6365_1 /TAXON_ID=91329 /ORGANISM="Norrisiella sphaerica, Strain BC52" /LENGTH=113 /DNA_ID=CAMNT_0026865765 /DNA_START=357 /DNA_END=695 /DNA_ORIENTATION=-
MKGKTDAKGTLISSRVHFKPKKLYIRAHASNKDQRSNNFVTPKRIKPNDEQVNQDVSRPSNMQLPLNKAIMSQVSLGKLEGLSSPGAMSFLGTPSPRGDLLSSTNFSADLDAW